jgi:dihydroorotase
VSPAEHLDITADLWVKNGVITHIGNSVDYDNDTRIVNAAGWICSPGFYDMHVHLREPGYEIKEDIRTGTNAAANGGFTGLCCMPNTNPPVDNAQTVQFLKDKGTGKIVDVGIAGTITQGREGKNLSPMFELADYGALMFTDDGNCVTGSEVMKRAFMYASTRDLLISQHCEDHDMTQGFSMNEGEMSLKLGLKGYPSVAEEIIVSRDLMLSKYCGNMRYHVSHISTKGSVELIRAAKSIGLRVSCEVTPHHISLNERLVESYSTDLKINPPLRTQNDIDALIQGLADGTIDCIASDHAPHALNEKDVEFEKAPCGIVGLETSLGVVLTYLYHTEKLTLEDIICKMSINPRNILRLPEISIHEGTQANLTIFDPNEEWIVEKKNFRSRSKNTPYEGYQLKGKPKFTINNNQVHEITL